MAFSGTTKYFEQKVINSFVYSDNLFKEVFSKMSSEGDGYLLNEYLLKWIQNKLTTDKKISGVVFTSIKDSPGINFAIFGDAIKELKVGAINLIKVISIDVYGCFQYELIDNSSSRDGDIKWRIAN